MKTISLFFCLLYAMWTDGGNIEVFEGGQFSVRCSHKFASEKNKYFCKNPCKGNKDILATVQSGRRVESGRITLVDSADGFFIVTFRKLRLPDSGKYWCGVDRPGVDTFAPVILNVKENPNKVKTKKTTVTPDISVTWTNQNIPKSTHLTSGMDTTVHTKQITDDSNYTSAKQNIGLDMVLYTTVGSIATLSVSLLLATRFRKRRDVVSADEGEFDNENNDIEKEVWSMMGLSEKNSGAHHPKQDPSTSVYAEVKYSAPLHISESICFRGATESRHSAANVLSTMISQRAGDGCLRKDTDAPAALRNAMIKVTDSGLSTVSVVYYRTCSDSTESEPRSLWFGFNLSE